MASRSSRHPRGIRTACWLIALVYLTTTVLLQMRVPLRASRATGTAFANVDGIPGIDDGTKDMFKFLLGKIRNPFSNGPSKTHVDLINFTLDVNLLNPSQWAVSIVENPESEEDEDEEEAHLIVGKIGSEFSYSAAFDTSKSRYDIPSKWIQRLAFALNSVDGGRDVDWMAEVESCGQKINITSQDDTLIYDIDLHAYYQFSDCLKLSYEIDTMRRPELDGPKFNPLQEGFALSGWKANYIKQGGKAQFATPTGEFVAGVFQRDPDRDSEGDEYLDYELAYESPSIFGIGNAGFSVVRQDKQFKYAVFGALASFMGSKNKMALELEGGKPKIQLELGGKVPLPLGVRVTMQGNISAGPAVSGIVQSSPIKFAVDADLTGKLPLVSDGSSVLVGGTFDPVTRRLLHPHGKVNMKVGSSISPVSMRARARVSEDGIVNGALGAGVSFGDVSVIYEARSKRLDISNLDARGLASAMNDGTAQVLEVKYSPAAQIQGAYNAARGALSAFSALDLPQGGAEVWGRVTKSQTDFGGRPRIQLGVSYNLGKLSSEEVSFDSAREEDAAMLDFAGRALKDRLADKAGKMKDSHIMKMKDEYQNQIQDKIESASDIATGALSSATDAMK